MDILANRIMNHFHDSGLTVGRHDRVEGVSNIDKVIIIDQSPIGKTPHSISQDPRAISPEKKVQKTAG